LRNKCAEKQIFAYQHQGHRSLKPWDGFLRCTAFPLFDHRVHPEGLGIALDKKLLNNSG